MKVGIEFFQQYFDIRSFSKKQKKHFCFNIALGVVVMLIFIILENTPWGQNLINDWFDTYIAWRTGSHTSTKEASKQIVFLEFDNQSMRELGRPSMTPRNKVAELVETAYQGGAKVIILDMEFSEPDYSPLTLMAGDTQPMDGQARDQRLFKVLAQIRKESSGTVLLLPLTTYADNTMQRNIYDSLVDDKNIYYVTPSFTTSKTMEKRVRFWVPYLTIKNVDREEVLWSIPMMCLAVSGNEIESLHNLAGKILSQTPSEYGRFELTAQEKKHNFIFYREEMEQKGILRNAETHQYNRIQYAMVPYELSKKYMEAMVSLNRLGHWRKEGIDNRGINYHDKIVIIGRSDQDSADFFSTPIGSMPGMYIHANSIATVLSESHPHLTPMYKHVLIELVLIVIAAYAFLHLPTIVAKLSLVLLFVACWGLSYLYFVWTNEFVNLSFSFMGIGIHDFISRMETLFEREGNINKH